MTTLDQIRKDTTSAMKEGRKDDVAVLRMLLAALQQAAKDGDSDELAVLRRERKRRREAEQAYRDAGREDLAGKEAAEAKTIETYLPQELTEQQVDELVARVVAEVGAEGPKDFGKVMKRVIELAEGRADGKTVAAKVKDRLG